MPGDAARRHRARESCHVLKSKCDRVGKTACGRCLRLGLDCQPAVRRLQRNRITELEAQIEDLTRALHSQAQISPQTPSPSEDIIQFLDIRVPESVQRHAFQNYARAVVPRIPIVPVSETSFEIIREESPILLLAILAFATSNVLDSVVRNKLVDKAMRSIGSDLIGSGDLSIPNIQAVLLACFWYRDTPNSKHSTLTRLVQLATTSCIEMGLSEHGKATFSSSRYVDADPMSMNGPRTWLACFVATSALSLINRREDSNTWTQSHESCLTWLRGSPLRTDRIFRSLVSITRIQSRIATCLGLHEKSSMLDFSDPLRKTVVDGFQAEIDIWSIDALATCSPALTFWHQMAIITLNEQVLHTNTNKDTFSAPYLPPGLAPLDFAAPKFVTVEHIVALHALKSACHAALDIATNLHPAVVLSLDSMSFIPNILFAFFVLMKLYVAASGPGSTYAAFLHKDELRIEHYMLKLGLLAAAVQRSDAASWNAMILGAVWKFDEWYHEYNAGSEKFVLKPKVDGVSVSPNADWDLATFCLQEVETA